MGKPTPGPWTVGQEITRVRAGDHRRYLETVIPVQTAYAGRVFEIEVDGRSHDDDEAAHADARLIAAAPDLLEAARTLLPTVERAFQRLVHAEGCLAGRKGSACSCAVAVVRDQLVAARAAIAKATGEDRR